MTTDPASGRVAIVTGGASATGFRIALRLIVDGVHVALFDSGDGVRDNAEALGADVLGVRVDPGDEQGMDAAISAVLDRFGRLDLLVNQACSTPAPKGFWGRSKRVDVLGAGLRGLTVATTAALPYLRASTRPGIVNIAPVAPTQGFVGGKPYSAEHMTVIGLTLRAAGEHRSAGVCVNAVVPVQDHPQLGVLGAPHDLAGAVSFLCSDRAATVTGEVVPVDTGYDCA